MSPVLPHAGQRHPGPPHCLTGLHTALLVGLLAAGAGGCSRGVSEMDRVHQALLDNLPGEWQPRIQVRAGGTLFGLARAGLAVARAARAEIPPEVGTAVSAVRGARVSVWRLMAGRLDRREFLARMDRSLEVRGWQRAVTVLDAEHTVVMCLPRSELSDRRLPAGVLVFDGRDLVVVTANTRADQISELALAALRESRRHAHATSAPDGLAPGDPMPAGMPGLARRLQ